MFFNALLTGRFPELSPKLINNFKPGGVGRKNHFLKIKGPQIFMIVMIYYDSARICGLKKNNLIFGYFDL